MKLHLILLGLVAFDMLVRAVRLRILVSRNESPRLWSMVRANALGDLFSAITPARLGGELARFAALRRVTVTGPVAVAALGIERVADLFLTVTVGLISVVLLSETGLDVLVDLAVRVTSSSWLPWFLLIGVITVGAGVLTYRWRKKVPPIVRHSLRESLVEIRETSGVVAVFSLLLTMLSMAARVSILPVIVSMFVPLENLASAVLGSIGLLYSQLILPTPAGVGGVELGFAAGLAGSMDTAAVVSAMAIWRFYTLGLPAGFGAAFLLGLGLKKAKAETMGVV